MGNKNRVVVLGLALGTLVLLFTSLLPDGATSPAIGTPLQRRAQPDAGANPEAAANVGSGSEHATKTGAPSSARWARLSEKRSRPVRFAKPRSDGRLAASRDLPMPSSIVIDGATIGDDTIDSSLPSGAKAIPGQQLDEKELLERYRFMDIVYTWVNGSEMVHMFKKYKVFATMKRRRSRRTSPPPDKKRPNIESFLRHYSGKVVNSRDRESGELMFSIRSIQSFMKWHQGRIIIVSPGHSPDWLDPWAAMTSRSLNFTRSIWNTTYPMGSFPQWLSSKLAEASNEDPLRNRIMVVHQDSLVPWAHRTTFNTNTIEPNIFRIKNLTKVFIQFNDDYMVGREAPITRFVNKYGGPVLLYERNVVRGGRLTYLRFRQQKSQKTWVAGVFHTNGVISDLLDYSIQGSVMDALGRYVDRSGHPSRHPKRLFVKHAPFVYCKEIHEYVYSATHSLLQSAGLENKFRNYSDILAPFIHHSIALDAPWRGSSQYINKNISSSTILHLDGEEACPPSTAKVGDVADSRLMIITDDVRQNDGRFNELLVTRPTFFALNDGFTKPQVSVSIRRFLAGYFPIPSNFERRPTKSRHLEEALSLFEAKPPLVLTVSHTDFLCPVIRSLAFGFPTFSGPIHAFVLHPDDVPKSDGLQPSQQQTMDAPDGTTTGMENDEEVSSWLVPCHLKSELTTIHQLEKRASLSMEAKFHTVFNAAYHKEEGVLGFIDFHGLNPVVGQTLALEDFDFIIQKSSTSDSFSVAKLSGQSVHLISAPSADILLRTFPLPYRRYENVPW